MVIKASANRQVDALVLDLRSTDGVRRETAVARLAVIGDRAVDRLIDLVRSCEPGAARTAALQALEAIGNPRALDAALQAIDDRDAGVGAAAIAVARAFLRGSRGSEALDRLMVVVTDRHRRESDRLAGLRALSDLEPGTLKPLWRALRDDPSAVVRTAARAGAAGREAEPRDAAEQLRTAAEIGLPADAGSFRESLSAGAGSVTPTVLLRVVERLREREALEGTVARGDEWRKARGAVHAALAARGSRLGVYDLRESLESASAPLPSEFPAALALVGDSSCLEAIAAARTRSRDAEWSRQLSNAFGAIVARDGITRRHAAMKRIERKWPGVLVSLMG